ncbi:MAG: hypothetical protein H8D34_20235 [Chloroflexi bacterium]|nr:hypothetical protein [Chloroflexota bacterium]
MSTPFIDEVYERVDFERDLVFKFFTVFSLFEYALKRAEFARATGNNNDVKPDWDRFAHDIEQDFNPQASPELANAVNYLLSFPVKRQVLRNDSLSFVPRRRPPNLRDTEWLSLIIRGIRNNLFHGGKFRYHPERDNELLQSSLIILEAWSECNDLVKEELRIIK